MPHNTSNNLDGFDARWSLSGAGSNGSGPGHLLGDRGPSHQVRSNRSRFMTLTHAETKSVTNFCSASALA